MSGLTRFLGDTPFRVLIRLIALSFIVGLVLAAFNLHPVQVYQWAERLFFRLYDMGFDAIESGFRYMVLGAMIVIPVFIVMRLLKMGRGQ